MLDIFLPIFGRKPMLVSGLAIIIFCMVAAALTEEIGGLPQLPPDFSVRRPTFCAVCRHGVVFVLAGTDLAESFTA